MKKSKSVRNFKSFTESLINIVYKKTIDEDRTTITAYDGTTKVGSIIIEILYNAYYEFDDVLDEDEFDELYPDNEIVKIEHIEVLDTYKNKGIGSDLMKRGIKLMKSKGYEQFYLNASPMGFSGLDTQDLVDFYEKFGFRILLDQGHNVLMSITKI